MEFGLCMIDRMREGGCEASGVTVSVLCLCSMNEEQILLNALLHLLLAV